VIGSLVAAAVEVYAPERMTRLLARMPAPVAIPVAGLMGTFFPVCDCGSIPVARRLANKGLHPAGCVAFMLGAPVVNPIVAFSTFVAFQFRAEVAIARMMLAYAVAVIAAWAMSPVAREMMTRPLPTDTGHSHEHHGSFHHVFSHDVVFMGRYLVIGALAAAAIQTFLPRAVFVAVSSNLPVSILAMMLLAVGLSICAQADAFVAASFTQFHPAALVAFLTLGPNVDLKLLSIYHAAFGARHTRRLVVSVALPVLVGSLWMSAITS
jgi:uncharacterized protein